MDTTKTPIRCVSLWQPWASLIAIGEKTVETRAWAAPQSIIGTRIGIHAAKTLKGMEIAKGNADLWHECVARMFFEIPIDEDEPCLLPFGSIVATAVVEACMPVERLIPDVFGDYSPGRYGWVLSGIERLAVPVPAKGRQGIFTVEMPA